LAVLPAPVSARKLIFIIKVEERNTIKHKVELHYMEISKSILGSNGDVYIETEM